MSTRALFALFAVAATSLVVLFASCAPAGDDARTLAPPGASPPPQHAQRDPPHGREDPEGPDPEAPDIAGVVDAVDAVDVIDAAGVASGWALSRAAPARALDVKLYVDGALVATVAADLPRGDVNEALGVAGDHGFAASVPSVFADGAAHALTAFAVDPAGGDDVALDNGPLSFTIGAACAGDVVPPRDDEFVVTLRADNGMLVSAHCGGDDEGLVTADGAGDAGAWETLYVHPEGGGAVSVRSSHGRYLSAEGAGGAALHANRTALGPWELFHLEGVLVEDARVALRTADDAHWVTAREDRTPPVVEATAPAHGPWEELVVHVVASPIRQRHGVVRAEGRNFVDDDGAFYPLGGTLFWSLYGWQNDRERLQQNLQFLASHRYDYVRILGEVEWTNETIDPNAPDWQQNLGEFIDYAYDQLGLRTELTLMGSNVDPMVTAQRAVPVILAGRTHKILDVEVANESYGRPVSLEHMREVGRYLRQSLPNLVALSSGEGLDSYAPNSSDWRADYQSVYMQPDTANLGTIHMDRGFGDGGWREVRQPWDWKDLPFPIAHNEPIGPRSSVAEEVDPVRLTMLRVVGLMNGVGAFVLHNGAGVAGVVDPGHNRPANLWEVPGIDGIMDAVRGVDDWMPARAGDGQHWNNAWAGNPWVADAFWGDGDDHGVNRNYTVATADGFIATESGILDHVVMTSSRHALVEIFDPLQGQVNEVELQAGEQLTLTPVSLDGNGDGALIVVGHYR